MGVCGGAGRASGPAPPGRLPPLRLLLQDPGKGGGQEQLYIFYADTPLGPWQPHAQNPVMVAPDRRGARMGGSLAKHRGKLIRFGQDCSEAYGHSVRACVPWGGARRMG